jgi:FtsP/CotA-like multicopper oxidase with cupredoxin domain
VALRAGVGRWRPEGSAGPALEVEALGEQGRALTVPAPLIRVPEGTFIAISIQNDLAAALVVHGLCTRNGSRCEALEVPPGQRRDVRFASGPAGTYHYWASVFGAPVPFRELAGAIVVDDPTRPVEPDRILVITEWSNLTPEQLRTIMTADDATEAFVAARSRYTFVINGLSWPATERLAYERGERVKWRVINLSSQAHPLHLHGFYFDVDSLGDGLRDSGFDAAHRRRVVTQLLASGGTLAMTWTPERTGNWLFHCHIMNHVSPDRRLGDAAAPADRAASHHASGDASIGMAGMVIGVTIGEPTASLSSGHDVKPAAPRKLTLSIEKAPGGIGELPGAGFVLSEGDAGSAQGAPVAPGPAIVLRRDQPVEITLVNHLPDSTAIHWHGIELDSYYDGVHGFSGLDRRVTPMIEPGGSFVVRFTPPRTGTFIYHTHLHDYRQLSSGLYGPLIVTDAGETFDPATDHVIVLGRSGLTAAEPSLLSEPDSVVMNGARAPRFVWKAGTRHRVRLINITPDDIFSVSLQTEAGPLTWTPVAKDGAPVPAGESVAGPATQTIAVGETYEFEFQAPEGRHGAWLEVRTTGGKWQAQGRLVIK